VPQFSPPLLEVGFAEIYLHMAKHVSTSESLRDSGTRQRCAKVSLHMATRPQAPRSEPNPASFYCPNCAKEVNDPLTCGDCSAIICRRCGTPLESPDELGIG
jgi:hypothetical protein